MDLNFPELSEISEEIKNINLMLKEIISSDKLLSEWYNDEQCWKLKGGGTLNSFRAHRYYQPKGGIPDAKVGGRKVWNKKTVQEWLLITDDQLEAYHKKYKTGATKN